VRGRNKAGGEIRWRKEVVQEMEWQREIGVVPPDGKIRKEMEK
jgi:hypothetical protein